MELAEHPAIPEQSRTKEKPPFKAAEVCVGVGSSNSQMAAKKMEEESRDCVKESAEEEWSMQGKCRKK